ncbi:linker histone H1M [Chanos chanos]|uniref:Linker histone H1M n=1 Tax=Chanos chanos TaxID=29144 RepID=A0A6J2WWT8_CHACN|nr:protein B4-like [Chanos chanos]
MGPKKTVKAVSEGEVAPAVKDPVTETSGKTEADVDGTSKAQTARKVSLHPPTILMVKEALKELDSRKGVSTQAIHGYIKEKYKSVDETRIKYMVKKALTKGIETGVFVRPANSTGRGAQGRFRLAKGVQKKEKPKKENANPNVQKKTKAQSEVQEPENKGDAKKPKPLKKKETVPKDTKPEKADAASKVAPAKKPKAKKPVGEDDLQPKAKTQTASKTTKTEGAEPKTAAPKKGKKASKEEREGGRKERPV